MPLNFQALLSDPAKPPCQQNMPHNHGEKCETPSLYIAARQMKPTTKGRDAATFEHRGDLMVALKNERQVFLWHVRPSPTPQAADAEVTLDDIVKILRTAYDANEAEIYLANGRVLPPDAPSSQKDPKNKIYIADFDDTNADYVSVLINRGDPNVVEPAFIDSSTKKVRKVIPKPSESQGWSAHLVIARKPRKKLHRAVFERVPHASSTYTDVLINTLLRRHAKENADQYVYEVNKKRGKKIETEQREYAPKLWIAKVPTEQIKKDIKKGTLTSITLMKPNAQFQGPDKNDIITSTKYKLELRARKADSSKILSLINEIKIWAKDEGFTEIKFNITDLPGDQSASPTFRLEQQDAAETLYVRTQRIPFTTVLEGCYAAVEPVIRREMAKVLQDDSRW